jgi:hypothetical protein
MLLEFKSISNQLLAIFIMLLPNYLLAEIPDEKIYGYCLNFFHERGKHKARIFHQVFGILAKDGEILKAEIISTLQKSEVTNIRENEYGTIYTVPLKICIFEREGEVITALDNSA